MSMHHALLAGGLGLALPAVWGSVVV